MKKNILRKIPIKRILIVLLLVFLINVFVLMPTVTIIVYESVFSHRYEPVSSQMFETEDFESLSVEESTFSSNEGQILAGYSYYKSGQPVYGVVVLAHGFGCGGQNSLMPFADFFTTEGYLVFAYDATGNGNSQGDSVHGLPQGVVDLDYALRYVKSHPMYRGLPIFLLGHSWGAYSAGAVLNLHPDVSAAVLISGPDRSIDLMLQESKNAVGFLGYTSVPYLMLYERFKFGDYASYTVCEGFENSEASVLIVQSSDDITVPPEVGYDKFKEKYGSDSDFQFILYEDRGHDRLFYSPTVAFNTLDPQLMSEICNLFEKSISN